MAGDLERFLQQAAERLAEKVNEANGNPAGGKRGRQQPEPPRTASRQPARNVRRAERAVLEPEILEPDIVDAEILDRALLGPDPLSSLDTRHLDPASAHRPELTNYIGQSDERMTDHVKHVTEHKVGRLKQASTALDSNLESDQRASTASKQPGGAEQLMNMLRQSDSLRAAFIASEIFKRPFS
ncbi:MAG: hypothetical protein AB8B50_14500 [Pirellulaceae bacterium]